MISLLQIQSPSLGQQYLPGHLPAGELLLRATHSGCRGPARLAWPAHPEDHGLFLGSTSLPGPRCGLVPFLQAAPSTGWEVGEGGSYPPPPFQRGLLPSRKAPSGPPAAAARPGLQQGEEGREEKGGSGKLREIRTTGRGVGMEGKDRAFCSTWRMTTKLKII